VKSLSQRALLDCIMVTHETKAQAVTTDAIIKKVLNAVPVR